MNLRGKASLLCRQVLDRKKIAKDNEVVNEFDLGKAVPEYLFIRGENSYLLLHVGFEQSSQRFLMASGNTWISDRRIGINNPNPLILRTSRTSLLA